MSEADEYSMVSKGKLRLKNDSEISKKKKKHKKHKRQELEKIERGAQEELDSIKSTTDAQNLKEMHITRAEQAFRKMQEKMVSFWGKLKLDNLIIYECIYSKKNE